MAVLSPFPLVRYDGGARRVHGARFEHEREVPCLEAAAAGWRPEPRPDVASQRELRTAGCPGTPGSWSVQPERGCRYADRSAMAAAFGSRRPTLMTRLPTAISASAKKNTKTAASSSPFAAMKPKKPPPPRAAMVTR